MANKSVQKRHYTLWEDQNKQIKRIATASLLFGVVILFNVLQPYSTELVKKAELDAEVQRFTETLNQTRSATNDLQDFTQTMHSVEQTIFRQPWMRTKDELIDHLAELNASGQGSWERYQAQADSTVIEIASQVKHQVHAPLLTEIENDSLVAALMPETITKLHALPDVLETWVQNSLGKRWYRTIQSKGTQVEQLSASLSDALAELSAAISREMPRIIEKKQALEQTINEMKNSAEFQNYEEKRAALEKEMEKILPGWLKGLVSVEQMVLFFPFIIAGLLVFVLGLGVSLTRHFNKAVDALEAKVIRQEPVLSSTWTIIHRGAWGTVITIMTYAAFSAAMLFFFEHGIRLLLRCNAVSGQFGVSYLSELIWLFRIALLSLIVYTLTQPFRIKQS